MRNFLLLFLLFLFTGAVFLARSTDPKKAVSNFEDCKDAGNPVAESYPATCRAVDGRVFTQDIGNEFEKIDMIRIEFPRPNDSIKSPLTIRGEARGNWFFEADFPIRLFDGEGREIGTAIATAQEDWMTENFVVFMATLTFETPQTATGLLVLEKDNPSGLSENADRLIVPVVFQ
jgi:hypothetical protein